MSKFLGESIDMKGAVILVAGGVSSANSQPFSLKDVDRVTVLCQLVAPLSSVLATAIAPATISVVCGTNREASGMTVLTGATFVMGQATIGELTKWESIAVSAHGTIATAVITIDGATYHIQANATFADKQLSASACSVFTHRLASAITAFHPNLETYGLVTAGNGTATSVLYIRRKDGAADSLSISISANTASSDAVSIQGISQTGMIEFTPNDVLATNSSYTHFGVRFNQAVTTQIFSAVVLREKGYQSTNVNRHEI